MSANSNNNDSLTKAQQREFLRAVLPACQPQEASPANTFTTAELNELRSRLAAAGGLGSNENKNSGETGPLIASMPQLDTRSRSSNNNNKLDIIRDSPWTSASSPSLSSSGNSQGGDDVVEEVPAAATSSSPTATSTSESPSWHGAPMIADGLVTQEFRQRVRSGDFTGTTNGICPGFLQCNLVVLPQGPIAFDFLLFCQRNKKACPLIEVCSGSESPFPVGVAKGADLRTDVPKYAIYRNGKLEKEVTDVTDYWPSNAVAFLIGCSFSYDGALLDANIPLKSADANKNVPMYRTNLPCRPAGRLQGNMVVSMKPIPALRIADEVQITNEYPHAHGGPVCVGGNRGKVIGIEDMDEPDWGDAIDVADDEVPVFHACGVTPQAVLMASGVDFAITHSAGHMFVTDLPSDTTF